MRFYPPFGYSILYKEYTFTRFDHQKKCRSLRAYESEKLFKATGAGFRVLPFGCRFRVHVSH